MAKWDVTIGVKYTDMSVQVRATHIKATTGMKAVKVLKKKLSKGGDLYHLDYFMHNEPPRNRKKKAS